jgi:mRNA interferase RelE/StbE
MIVKYRKSFFNDVSKIRSIKQVEDIEFITEIAHSSKSAGKIPGLKMLRQYAGMARIEVAPYRIGVEITGNTIIFKRVILRNYFYEQFP